MDETSFAPPPIHLTPAEDVQKLLREWGRGTMSAKGYPNYGNTCYLNAILQCLIRGTPLGMVPEVLREKPTHSCAERKQCLWCSVFEVVRVGSPQPLVQAIAQVGRFRVGRQEDCHDFFRLLIDKLTLAQAAKAPRMKDVATRKLVEMTSLPNQLFGGWLLSQVHCLRCKGRFNTYQEFLDLSLNVLPEGVHTVNEALRLMVAPDTLSRADQYSCEKCKRKTDAEKRIAVHYAPPVLVLHLQRFAFGMFGARKVAKDVKCPQSLDLSPYLSTSIFGGRKSPQPHLYDLTALALHQGATSDSGHYTALVKVGGRWIHFDDSRAGMTSDLHVQSACKKAYVAFYVSRVPEPNPYLTLPQLLGAVPSSPQGSLSSPQTARYSAVPPIVRHHEAPSPLSSLRFEASGRQSSLDSDDGVPCVRPHTATNGNPANPGVNGNGNGNGNGAGTANGGRNGVRPNTANGGRTPPPPSPPQSPLASASTHVHPPSPHTPNRSNGPRALPLTRAAPVTPPTRTKPASEAPPAAQKGKTVMAVLNAAPKFLSLVHLTQLMEREAAKAAGISEDKVECCAMKQNRKASVPIIVLPDAAAAQRVLQKGVSLPGTSVKLRWPGESVDLTGYHRYEPKAVVSETCDEFEAAFLGRQPARSAEKRAGEDLGAAAKQRKTEDDSRTRDECVEQDRTDVGKPEGPRLPPNMDEDAVAIRRYVEELLLGSGKVSDDNEIASLCTQIVDGLRRNQVLDILGVAMRGAGKNGLEVLVSKLRCRGLTLAEALNQDGKCPDVDWNIVLAKSTP